LKSWISKFKTKKVISQLGGIIDFATHFEKYCQPSSIERNDILKLKYEKLPVNYYGSRPRQSRAFVVELTRNLIEYIIKGKASGLDGLTSDHLKYSHPILVVVLCKLFNLFVSLRWSLVYRFGGAKIA